MLKGPPYALGGVPPDDSEVSDPFGVTIIPGEEIPSLLGKQTIEIHVRACRSGEAVIVPFQVDERDRRDRWVLDHGPAAGVDESPGVFDRNDAIVVRNRSVGERCDAVVVGQSLDHGVEVRIGPAGSPLGFLYAGTSPLPQAESGSVRYDPAADLVETDAYSFGFGEVLPDLFAIQQKGDRAPRNLLQALRAHGEARLFGGLIVLRRSEEDLTGHVEGYRQGPLRVIRRAKYSIRLPLGFRARAIIQFTFYEDLMIGSAVAKVRIPPFLIPGDGELAAYLDLRNFAGATVVLDRVPIPGRIDGAMGPADHGLAGSEGRWAAISAPGGRSFLLCVRRGGALARLDQRFLFRDRPPDDGTLSLGFTLSGVRRLETGAHPLDVIGVVSSTDPSRIAHGAEALLSPPEIAVASLEIGP